ncbi:MAG: hypothetical protein FWH18_01950 [Marinilabiliaceae bacterium]|nr:hypothetical protein [Marinilabiliaceae bacterium]
MEKTENGYIYNSDIANEQYLLDKHILTRSDYGLWNSINKKSKTLFPDFEDIIMSCSRSDILYRANICSSDSKWDKLVKLSALKWFTPNAYVNQITHLKTT